LRFHDEDDREDNHSTILLYPSFTFFKQQNEYTKGHPPRLISQRRMTVTRRDKFS
jgi:hypothetical protein